MTTTDPAILTEAQVSGLFGDLAAAKREQAEAMAAVEVASDRVRVLVYRLVDESGLKQAEIARRADLKPQRIDQYLRRRRDK